MTVSGSSTKIYKGYYYDVKVRVTKVVQNNLLGDVYKRQGYLYESENHKTSGILMFSVKSYDDFNVRRGSYTTCLLYTSRCV